jgi:PAS domain-containing protein
MLGKANFAGDNVLLYRLRWVLLAWMGAAGSMRLGNPEMSTPWWVVLLVLFVASQVVLLKLPAAWVTSQRFHTVVFLGDLALVLAVLLSLGRLTPDLTLALSLTVFTTALAQSLSLAAVVATVSVGVYLAFLSRGAGFDPTNVDQLLDLPFIFIQGLHGAVIVTEMRFRQEMSDALAADNKTLQRKLGGSLVQLREQAGEAASWVESIPAAALVLSAVGEIMAFNKRAEDTFELRRSLVLRRAMKEVGFFDPIEKVLSTREGDSAVGVAEFKTKSGKVIALAVRAGVSRDGEGHLRHIGVVFGPWSGPLPEGAFRLEAAPSKAPLEAPLTPAPEAPPVSTLIRPLAAELETERT